MVRIMKNSSYTNQKRADMRFNMSHISRRLLNLCWGQVTYTARGLRYAILRLESSKGRLDLGEVMLRMFRRELKGVNGKLNQRMDVRKVGKY